MELKFTKSTPLKIWLILLAILAIASISFPVKAAETFNETLLFTGGGTSSEILAGNGNNMGFGYTVSDIGTITGVYNNFDNQKIPRNITTGNHVTSSAGNLLLSLTASANGINQLFTPFSATEGGNYFGVGSIGWIRTSGNNFNYKLIFDSVDAQYASTITGKQQIAITYNATAVFQDYITSTSGGAGDNGWDCDYIYFKLMSVAKTRSTPLYGQACVDADTQSISFTFNDQSTLSFNNTSTNFGYVNLSKNGFNQRLNITNSSGTSFYDVTSINNVVQYTQKSTGIIANVFDVTSGIWANRTLVDASGNPPTVPPPPTPPAGGVFNPPLTIPASGGSIQFHQTKYVVGDSPSVEWAIANSEWGCFFCSAWLIEIKDDNGNTIAGRWALGSQTGNRSILSYQTGTWTATLTKGALFPEVMGTATTVIQSSANTEDTITTSKSIYNTTDIITVSGYKLSPYPGWIAISPYDSPYNYVRTYGTTVDFTGITGGTLLGNYTYSTALPEGKYLAQLHIGSGISPAIKEVIFNVNSSGNFAIYWVSADQFGNHFLPGFTGEFFDIRYSSKTQSDIISVTSPKGITYDTWTVSNYPGEHQIFITGSTDNLGTWTAKIQNASNASDYSTGLITLIQPGTIGTNTNVTLTWTPSTVVQKNHAILSWYVNNISNYRILVSSGNTVYSNQTYVNTASGSLDFVFQNVGSYYAIMTNETDGSLLKQVVLTVTSSVPSAPTPISTGGAGAGATDQWGKNLLAFLTMPAFWGLAIFLVGLYVAGQAGTRAQQAIPYVAFILLNIEAAFGLWVPFTLYILAVIWIGAGLVGVFGGLLKR